ncbi:hypothetical protein GMSM_22720 [Geomonas sp. Red276]
MMTKRSVFPGLILALSLCLIPATVTAPLAAEGGATSSTDKPLDEMPVLTGNDWRVLTPETKLAFILGVGHVVTIEENVIERHPDLRRKGFVAKLAEGLAGVPMDSIIRTIDTYYTEHPDDLGLPVMAVMWQQLVRPKLKTGIADRPFSGQN